MKTLGHSITSLFLALIFCGTSLAEEKIYKIAVIPKGTTHEFWNPSMPVPTRQRLNSPRRA